MTHFAGDKSLRLRDIDNLRLRDIAEWNDYDHPESPVSLLATLRENAERATLTLAHEALLEDTQYLMGVEFGPRRSLRSENTCQPCASSLPQEVINVDIVKGDEVVGAPTQLGGHPAATLERPPTKPHLQRADGVAEVDQTLTDAPEAQSGVGGEKGEASEGASERPKERLVLSGRTIGTLEDQAKSGIELSEALRGGSPVAEGQQGDRVLNGDLLSRIEHMRGKLSFQKRVEYQPKQNLGLRQDCYSLLIREERHCIDAAERMLALEREDLDRNETLLKGCYSELSSLFPELSHLQRTERITCCELQQRSLKTLLICVGDILGAFVGRASDEFGDEFLFPQLIAALGEASRVLGVIWRDQKGMPRFVTQVQALYRDLINARRFLQPRGLDSTKPIAWAGGSVVMPSPLSSTKPCDATMDVPAEAWNYLSANPDYPELPEVPPPRPPPPLEGRVQRTQDGDYLVEF